MRVPGNRGEQLRAALDAAAQDLVSSPPPGTLDEALIRIVRAAVEAVPAADAGGITLVGNGSVDARAPSNSTVEDLDKLQSTLHEGPCVTAAAEGTDILVTDLAGTDAERWPAFAARAVEAGYRSMLSTYVATTAQWRVSLNLYGEASAAFDPEARELAGLFSAQAVVLIRSMEGMASLHRAIDSRDLIGQAKGILMERFDIDDAEAFRMLVRSSQDTNVKLVDVARWLQDEGRERRSSRSGSDHER